jgi:hypothetical protein
MGTTLDLKGLIAPENLASSIANKWLDWNMLRAPWLAEKLELRNYIFATDTTKTSNRSLPWKNSTTLPKLCQIRDNLHANYNSALFPNDEWIVWEGDNRESTTAKKAAVMQAFIRNKTKVSGFQNTVSRLLYDWIDYGNCFATIEFVNESRTNPKTGESFPGYVGPKLRRISPFDIVFNPVAASFEETPKLVRTLKSYGELAKDVANNAYGETAKAALAKAQKTRSTIKGLTESDFNKDHGFQIDGFSSMQHYYNSDMVELITFYGDLYDFDNDVLLENHCITIMDRAYILEKKPSPNWLGRDHFYHIGWRFRPDNLYAMGPLDNLVGMQYRIDHLENLKADAFDLIAFPVMKIKGDVQNFVYQPGERIYVGDEGDVDFMHPDAAALAADNQIAILEQKMEEMAGAPKQAMGIRTPGEKTAFEVQSLENAAGRIFQNKTLGFERDFLAPILNAMLEVGRRHLDAPELVPMLDSDVDVVTFKSITKEDLKASGKLRPVGASHFQKRNILVQNLVTLLQSPVGMDPAINVHLSGRQLAKAAEDILDLGRFELFKDNARIFEALESERLKQDGIQQLQQEAVAEPGAVPGDSAYGDLAPVGSMEQAPAGGRA